MTLYQCPLCKRLEASDDEAPPECSCACRVNNDGYPYGHKVVMREIIQFRHDAVWHTVKP